MRGEGRKHPSTLLSESRNEKLHQSRNKPLRRRRRCISQKRGEFRLKNRTLRFLGHSLTLIKGWQRLAASRRPASRKPHRVRGSSLTHLLHIMAVPDEGDGRGKATGISALDLNPRLLSPETRENGRHGKEEEKQINHGAARNRWKCKTHRYEQHGCLSGQVQRDWGTSRIAT